MSSEENRETEVSIPRQELFYYDEDKGSYKPLASNGSIPVYIVEEDELSTMGNQSPDLTGRETRM